MAAQPQQRGELLRAMNLRSVKRQGQCYVIYLYRSQEVKLLEKLMGSGTTRRDVY